MMRPFTVVIIFSFCLAGLAVNSAYPQELGLWVLKPCAQQRGEQEKSLKARETHFQVGCTVQMICTYEHDYCDDKNKTNLTVTTRGDFVIVQEINKTKCSLIVELQNLQKDNFRMYCRDRENRLKRRRTVMVGYPPVTPENLTIVFEPTKSLSLLLNQVKDGKDLNDEGTQWSVNYTWRSNHECERKGQQIDEEDGRFVACYMDLDGHYKGSGMYDDPFGNMYSPINFTVNVRNMFGETAPISETFYPQDYVKPGKVRDVFVTDRGASWISLQVKFPHGMEKQLCKNMSENRSSALKIEYTVTYMAEETQHELGNNTFYMQYGFYRNLDDDKEAVLSVIKGYTTREPFITRELFWPNCENNTTVLNITDLPLPDTFYKIHLRAGGRYWGRWLELDMRQIETRTGHTAPKRPPELYNSSYYCFPPTDECNVTCVVYFKAIPRPLRGGDISEYILQVTKQNASGLGSRCSNANSFDVKRGGQSNTIIVKNLAPNTVYGLRLQANVKEGLSSASFGILDTSDTTGKHLHVVVERHGDSYDVSWSSSQDSVTSDTRYFVHDCYADSLRDVSTPGPLNKLDCKTNMKTTQVNGSTRVKSVSMPYLRGASRSSLVPALFVSMKTEDGAHSSLVKPECLYDIEKGPRKESFDIIKIGTTQLFVGFEHECPEAYIYGRPLQLCAAVAEAKPGVDCVELLTDAERQCEQYIKPNVRIEKLFTGLNPATQYCVGISSEKRDSNPVWEAQMIQTAVDEENGGYTLQWLSLSVVLSTTVLVLLVIFLIWYLCRCTKKHTAKFRYSVQKLPLQWQSSSRDDMLPPPPPPITAIPSLEGRVNPALMSDPCEDSGIATEREQNSDGSTAHRKSMIYNSPSLDVEQPQEPGHRNSWMANRSLSGNHFEDVDETAQRGPSAAVTRSRYPGGLSPPREDIHDEEEDEKDEEGQEDDEEDEEEDEDEVQSVGQEANQTHESNSATTAVEERINCSQGVFGNLGSGSLTDLDASLLDDPLLSAAAGCHTRDLSLPVTVDKPEGGDGVNLGDLSTLTVSLLSANGQAGSGQLDDPVSVAARVCLPRIRILAENRDENCCSGSKHVDGAASEPDHIIHFNPNAPSLHVPLNSNVPSAELSRGVARTHFSGGHIGSECNPVTQLRAGDIEARLVNGNGSISFSPCVCDTADHASMQSAEMDPTSQSFTYRPDVTDDLGGVEEDHDLDFFNDPVLQAGQSCEVKPLIPPQPKVTVQGSVLEGPAVAETPSCARPRASGLSAMSQKQVGPFSSLPHQNLKCDAKNDIALKMLPRLPSNSDSYSGDSDLSTTDICEDGAEATETNFLLENNDKVKEDTKWLNRKGEKSSLLSEQSRKELYSKVTKVSNSNSGSLS